MRYRLVGAFFAVWNAAIAASGPAAASPAHRIQLDRFIASVNQIAGLSVKARVNGGPPLHLLLDSGAQWVVLRRSSAARSGCNGGSRLDLVGAGAPSAASVIQAVADRIELGDLALRNVPLLISDRPMPDGIQGVVPLSLFAGFLTQLNVPAKELDLFPYPSEPMNSAEAIPVRCSNQLLFLKATVNQTHEGYFLIDTGSAYTAVSRNLAHALHESELLDARLPLDGGLAAINAPVLNGRIQLQVASRVVTTGPVVAVDLSTASRYHHFEISGLIGYNALRDSILTVNYRDGLVQITPK